MRGRTDAFLSELPPAPEFNPIRRAMERAADPEVVAALGSFSSMPASTGILANPVRYHHTIACAGDSMELAIRSFAIRGCLLEEDIIEGSVDAFRVIFVGLFGRFPKAGESESLSRLCNREFTNAIDRILSGTARFMKTFPNALPTLAMQHMACNRKAAGRPRGVNASRPSAELLRELIAAHMENSAVLSCASYMRHLLAQEPATVEAALVRQTRRFVKANGSDNPFEIVFSLLLRERATATQSKILQRFGTIQIHHGSAGSNMVARYLASLHSRSVEDLFMASQMTLDCARHFGAITDLTEFVSSLERHAPGRRDALIRRRAMTGNLPAFGHPEIAAAGRGNRIEIDPRPAIYIASLFEAMDDETLQIPDSRMKRIGFLQRMYQIAFVEGIEKPGRNSVLRIAPNTDFGAWMVQEALNIDEVDRTLLSYVYRGFGWMMDVREQLQQPIIRPVIPPDPHIVPASGSGSLIPNIVETVHRRLGNRGLSPN